METLLIGNRRCTSIEALNRFYEAVSQAKDLHKRGGVALGTSAPAPRHAPGRRPRRSVKRLKTWRTRGRNVGKASDPGSSYRSPSGSEASGTGQGPTVPLLGTHEAPSPPPKTPVIPRDKSYDAWVFASLLSGQTLNGEIDAVSSHLKRMVEFLNGLKKESRQAAWLAMMAARDDSEKLIQAVADQDPSKPPPAVNEPVEYATVADVRKTMAVIRWNWEGWIPAVRLLGLASLEGTGKTRTAMDLHRRVYQHLPWPDGQKMTLPKGSPAIWVCADGQHEEIADLVKEYELPDSSVIFPAPCDDPWRTRAWMMQRRWHIFTV